MQVVLSFSPLDVGVAFLPANLIMAVCSIGISALLIKKFGVKLPIIVGMLLIASGLFLFSIAPVNGTLLLNIMPAMVLLGFGCGIALNPVILAAMNDVAESKSGLASGIINTSFMLGGALGLAILASVATYATSVSLASGETQVLSILSGYHLAFLFGSVFALLAAILALVFLREKKGVQSSQAHTMH